MYMIIELIKQLKYIIQKFLWFSFFVKADSRIKRENTTAMQSSVVIQHHTCTKKRLKTLDFQQIKNCSCMKRLQ